MQRTPVGDWVPIEKFVGEPHGSPLVWWWNTAWPKYSGVAEFEEILLDADGKAEAKRDGDIKAYTHVRLAGIERPKPPVGKAWVVR